MTETVPYRAFLSHSPVDRGAARRLHRQLKRLLGNSEPIRQKTPADRVATDAWSIARITPARDDTAELDALTIAALDQSELLIVVASPAAARSAQVNGQVRHFRHNHPDRPVVAVIAAGKPEAGHHHLFPPALCHALDAGGAVTTNPVHVEVGDIRHGSRERARVPAAIAALMTGLDADELFARVRHAVRRRFLRWAAIGVSAMVLLTGGAYFGAQAYREFKFRGEVAALVNRHAPASVAHSPPGAHEFLAAAITSIRIRANADQRHLLAISHLRGGRLIDAEGLLREMAYEQAVRLDADPTMVAESFRNFGAVAGLIEPPRARDAMARAVTLGPQHTATLFRQGWLAAATERQDEAEAAFRALLALPTQDGDRRDLIWARILLGEIMLARGDLPAAAAIVLEAKTIATRAARTGGPTPQRDLAIAHERAGDVQTAQRDFAAAEQSLRASQAILVRLAAEDTANPLWQRDIALSHEKFGTLLLARSDTDGALRAYRSAQALFQALGNAQPDNASWPRGVARSHTLIAAALEAQGDRPAALEEHRSGMAILERLAAREPVSVRVATNAALLRELFGAFVQMADFLLRAGDPAAARPLATRAVTLATDLLTHFPTDPRRQADLASAKALRERIVAASPGN